jgi:hypothetical protein
VRPRSAAARARPRVAAARVRPRSAARARAAELKKSFAECKFAPEKKQKSLRFAVGDKVSCNTGEGWKEGTVVQLMYREAGMPAGMVAPYQVKLDSGHTIFLYLPCTFPVPSLYLPPGEARLRTHDLRPRGRGLGLPEGVDIPRRAGSPERYPLASVISENDQA